MDLRARNIAELFSVRRVDALLWGVETVAAGSGPGRPALALAAMADAAAIAQLTAGTLAASVVTDLAGKQNFI